MKKTWIIIWGLINFAFSGFLTQPLTNFVKGLFSDDKATNLGWLLDNRFSLMSFVIFAVVFIIVYGLSILIWHRIPKNKGKRREKKIQAELMKFNSLCFHDIKVKATWEVVPEGMLDDSPFISNLQLFCLHESHQPIRMQNGHCPYNGCPNHTRRVHEHQIRNLIESELILKKQSMRNNL